MFLSFVPPVTDVVTRRRQRAARDLQAMDVMTFRVARARQVDAAAWNDHPKWPMEDALRLAPRIGTGVFWVAIGTI